MGLCSASAMAPIVRYEDGRMTAELKSKSTSTTNCARFSSCGNGSAADQFRPDGNELGRCQQYQWASDVRAGTNGGFQFNLWIPDPPPKRDAAAEAAVRDFLANWGPPVPPEAGNVVLPDFQAQCDALLEEIG